MPLIIVEMNKLKAENTTVPTRDTAVLAQACMLTNQIGLDIQEGGP